MIEKHNRNCDHGNQKKKKPWTTDLVVLESFTTHLKVLPYA